jgi:D-alanine transaminase
MTIAYLNGEFADVASLRIPVLDRGFLFGDAVYEVLPVYQGRPFRSEFHYQRLQRSLANIHMDTVLEREQWSSLIQQLVSRNGGGSMAVYIQISRGAENTRNHLIPRNLTPTVFAMTAALKSRSPEVLERGLHVITHEDTRWSRCDIKSTSLLANILLYSEAHEQHAQECLLHRDGQLTEGSTSSIFVVKKGRVYAPPYGPEILPGTTRDLVAELCEANGTPVREGPIDMTELADADEIWLASATRELLPVTRVDGHSVGDGHPGPLWRAIDSRFQDYKLESAND